MTPGEKAHAAWKAVMDAAYPEPVPTWAEVSEFPAEVAAWEAAARANEPQYSVDSLSAGIRKCILGDHT